MTSDDAVAARRRRAWWALVLLAAVNLLNYLDRNIIFALFQPIKLELGLSDAQLGWLGSAYILVFSLTALPAGILSDMKSRRGVIATGVAVWSGFTFLGGLARNYGQLFFCRAAVGVGEAAYGPAAASLTADYFPGKDRAIAMGILQVGVPLGGVLGLLLGGVLDQLYGWRVALMAVGLPGFICAWLVTRIKDPTRVLVPLTLRKTIRDLEIGIRSFAKMFWESILAIIVGAAAAWMLSVSFAANSAVDVAAMAVVIAIGLALNIWRWVRLVQRGRREATPWTREFEGALDEMIKAGHLVLATPTLVYLFIAGAMIAFGLNGIVGWGPTFMTRTFGLSAGESAAMLGRWGLLAGVAGALTGGVIADLLGRHSDRGRVLTVVLGLLIGGPLAIWLLTIRDLDLFIPVFAIAFFFLSWYNGPMMAVIFDVVPSRIGATVSGAYLLFIHLAGDAIAFPLVGTLSDRIGLDQAVMVLPVVAVAGGLVTIGAMRTVSRDMNRVALMTTGSHPVG